MKVTSYLSIGESYDDGLAPPDLSEPFDALARAVLDEIRPWGRAVGTIRITVAFETEHGARWKVKGKTLPDAPAVEPEPAPTPDPTPGYGSAIVTRDGSPADPADAATLATGLKAAGEAIKIGRGGGPWQVEPMVTATATDCVGTEWKVVANLTQPATVQLTAHEIGLLLSGDTVHDIDGLAGRLTDAQP